MGNSRASLVFYLNCPKIGRNILFTSALATEQLWHWHYALVTSLHDYVATRAIALNLLINLLVSQDKSRIELGTPAAAQHFNPSAQLLTTVCILNNRGDIYLWYKITRKEQTLTWLFNQNATYIIKYVTLVRYVIHISPHRKTEHVLLFKMQLHF